MTLTDAWYALQVKPRTELCVAHRLQEKGYESFVPSYRSRRRWADRVREVQAPLIPDYVFCRTTGHAAGYIVTTPGVIRFVGAGRDPIAIDEAEIAALRRVSEACLRVEPAPYVHVGQRVELAAGPLHGLQGILKSFANGDRLIVSISLLRRSVSVEVSRADVRPIVSGGWSEQRVGVAGAMLQ